ncbi:MAG TPA: ABC-2 family transporter protein [Polyangia bacterium]|jgi:ABC-2 type transport system permease protein
MSGRAGGLALTIRAFPTLLKIGLAEAVAYRAEMIIWALTTTMPLVNLALWHTVAARGPIGGFGQPELIAYFLASFVVRQLTGSWVVWEMNGEIRSGRLSMRLLRPIHPLFAYMAENLAALPMRMAMSLPVLVLAFFLAGASRFNHDPAVWLMALAAVVGAWMIMFLSMSIMGSLAFFMESSTSLVYVWQALFFALSGYLFPLEFLQTHAPRVMNALHALPFYYQSGFPIELILGHHGRTAALHGLGVMALYVAGLYGLLALVWRAGIRRWNAFGA